MSNNAILPGFDDEKDSSLSIILKDVKNLPECLIIFLYGYLDKENEQFFAKQINKIINENFTTLIIDCSHLKLTDDSCLVFSKALNPYRENTIIVNLKQRYIEIYDLLGILKSFNVRNTIEEALATADSNKKLRH